LTGSSSSSNTSSILSDSVSLIEMFFLTVYTDPLTGSSSSSNTSSILLDSVSLIEMFFLTVYTDPLTGSSSSSNTSDCLTKVVSERAPLSLGQAIPPAGRGHLCNKIAGRIVRKCQALMICYDFLCFSNW